MIMKNFKIKNLISFASISFLALICFTSCKTEKNKQEGKSAYIIPDSLLKTLKIDTVRKTQLINDITLTGSVDFDQDHQVNIYPLVSGNIQDIKVQLGDHVQAGQTLAIIKSSEMAGYSNNLIIAETNVTTTKKQLDAQKDLFASGLASQLDVINAQANYDQALAQLEMIKRILKINGNNTQGDYIVKAPISGFIVQKNVTNNTSIRADNGTNIFTISDLKKVWIQANVYEANISKIHVGEKVSVTTVSYPDRIFTGTVDKIVNVLDPSSKVMKVRVVLNNEDYALKPQMYANIIVIQKTNTDAISVPLNSVIFDHSQYFVLSYRGSGKAEITPVEVLSKNNDKIYLAKGVKEGDLIIASNTFQMYDQLNN
ncbi:MAG: efflux RND transporter periplasmic adaptor subunit [Chitinophaga sp.]|jgi:membrane fusion protein, heavy metal efflux system|nr:efflux RND transporter periplasmic adaptor subunit [Chitinophaga sp.]